MPVTPLDARSALVVIDHATLPLDAITDVDPQLRDHSIHDIFPSIAETGSTADVLALPATRGTAG